MSIEQTHWVNHICDEYVNASQKAVGMYCNLHGFEEAGGIYWVGIDIRFIGIRVQDILIKCHNKSTYDYWINRICRKGPDGVVEDVKNDPKLSYQDGEDVNIEFIFRWGDEDKNFNIHVWGDIFAEEKQNFGESSKLEPLTSDDINKMVKEYYEIDKRINNIEKYMKTFICNINITDLHYRMVQTQYFAMLAYEQALRMRLEDLGIEV